MYFSTTHLAVTAATIAAVAATPIPTEGAILAKREISYGNPDLVTDQGDRFKLNYSSQEARDNPCPDHFICYIPRNGVRQDDVSLGNPDSMVDEGNRWRLNYGDITGHVHACDGHLICYIYK